MLFSYMKLSTQTSSMANWSELPIELLELIGNRIDNSSDARRFRAVCPSWRSSLPSFSPIHQTPSHFPYQCNQQLILVKRTIFCLSLPSKQNSSWLIMTEEHKPGLISLICSPFSTKYSTKHMMIKTFDFTELNISQIAHQHYVLRNNVSHDMEHEKVAFTCNNIDDYILLSTHKISGKLLIYRSISNEWKFLENDTLGYNDSSTFSLPLRYVDVVNFEGSFLVVTDYGKTVVIDVGEDSSLTFKVLAKSIIGGDKKCLVKSDEELLLVDMYTSPLVLGPFEVNAVDVYKFDKVGQKWTLLTSLGDRSIFISENASFTTSCLKGLKENCIYYHFSKLEKGFNYEKKDIKVGDYEGSLIMGPNEIGAFDYEKGNFSSLQENLKDGVELFHWPPPTWITPFM